MAYHPPGFIPIVGEIELALRAAGNKNHREDILR